MQEFYAKEFVHSCSKGNIDELKKNLQQQVDINHQDKEGFSGIHHAAMNNQLEVIHYLEQNGWQTALHVACDRNSKEIILYLLTHGIDPEIKNNQNLKAGEGNIENKMFVSNIAAENKAFNVLSKVHIQKLTQIFEEIDYENTKSHDFKRAFYFNKWVDETVTDNMAEKDARDFINSVAICNKTVVNIDEWLFAFSKLYVVDYSIFEKFISDYDQAVTTRGRFRDWVQENYQQS